MNPGRLICAVLLMSGCGLRDTMAQSLEAYAGNRRASDW
jgi:hypothetical protein